MLHRVSQNLLSVFIVTFLLVGVCCSTVFAEGSHHVRIDNSAHDEALCSYHSSNEAESCSVDNQHKIVATRTFDENDTSIDQNHTPSIISFSSGADTPKDNYSSLEINPTKNYRTKVRWSVQLPRSHLS